MQYYAINCKGEWTILYAPIPCHVGKGEIVAQDLTEEQMEYTLKQLTREAQV